MKKRKSYKICFLASSFYPAVVYGGPTYSNLSLCKNVESEKFHIQVLTTNANKSKRLDVETDKNYQHGKYFNVRYFNETIIGRFSWQFLMKGKKYIKNHDLIHCVDMFSTIFLMGLYFSRSSGQTILISPRGALSKWGMMRQNLLKNIWVKRFVANNLGRINFLATSEKEKMEIQEKIPQAEVYMIPNGIELMEEQDISHLKSMGDTFLEKYKIEGLKGKSIVSSLGRMHKKKGFDILIESVKDIDNIVLIIAGPEGEESGNLKNKITLNKLKNVYILNNLNTDEKNVLLSISDIFALPSYDENFGNVYLEALNLGTPIVASKFTPWKSVDQYNSGLWVDNDINSFKKAIEIILKDPLKFTTMNCRLHAAQFSTKSTSKQFKALYEELIIKES